MRTPFHLAASLILAAALTATSAAAQLDVKLPREATKPAGATLPEGIELRLPEYLGAGSEAAKLWITPEIFVGSLERAAPGSATGTPGEIDASDVPGIGGRILGFPEPGAAPVDPGLLDEIVVINARRRGTVTVDIECYDAEGGAVPGLSSRSTVGPRSMLGVEPVQYRGEGDGRGGRALSVWCAVSASEPVLAHGRTAGQTHLPFFAGLR